MSKPLAPSVTTRDPKGRKFVSIIESAYNKANLSEDEAQSINEVSGLSKIIGEFINTNRASNQFAHEELQSSYGYPKDYKVKGIPHQIKIIHESFPEVSWGYFRPDEDQITVPNEAEGLFAIPRWQILGKTYGEAVEKVLKVIASQRKFYNYRHAHLAAEYLRQHAKTAKMFQVLADEQKDHDILVVPAQFGLRHKGRSVRRAREVFAVNEFGLGAFAIGIMVLTHPEREVQWEQLHVDCTGDEFAPGADGDFLRAPIFYFDGGRVGFSARLFNLAVEYYGSASAFVSQ